MNQNRPLLITDAAINLLIGGLLLFFPRGIVAALGLPGANEVFYPSILGAVLVGIGVALLVDCFGDKKGVRGLGLAGAVSINLCGGIVLAAWLCFGSLDLPTRGFVILWCLVLLLVGISALEVTAQARYCHHRSEE